MCFKAPKPPKVPPADPALARQVEQASQAERERRTENKNSRLEDALKSMNGGFGRRSLLTGGRGGAGFSMPVSRSLFVQG